MLVGFCAAVATITLGCRKAEHGVPADAQVEAPRIPAEAGHSPLEAGAPVREPLAGFPSLLDLPAPEESKDKTRLGCVAVPLGARARRPLVVALHGGSDRPEWACSAWRRIASEHAFVVCPRGPGNEAGLAWYSPEDTRARVERAVAATRASFADWIADGPTVLVGFSMGATQAALLARHDPSRFPRVVLAESAYAPEAAMSFARPWAAKGGERAIFLCTTPGCVGTYRNAAKNVARLHVPARLVDAGTSAHGMWDEVVRAMRRDWPWLVEGLAGWESFDPPSEAAYPGKTEFFPAD